MVQLSANDLARLVSDDPHLYSDFYALTYENFQTVYRIIVNLAIPSTDKRIADRLLLEVETRGDAEGWISLSKPELARLVAVSLPTLQRVMRRFASGGLVTSSYARIQVMDRNALVRLCRG
jgi:CRP/FNR family transcriptional regulator, cyclic AMP receptor protein